MEWGTVPGALATRALCLESVHSKGFSSLISLIPFVKSSRFTFGLRLRDRHTETDNGKGRDFRFLHLLLTNEEMEAQRVQQGQTANQQ